MKRRFMQSQCIYTFVTILLVEEPYLSGISTTSAAASASSSFAGSAPALGADAETLSSLGLSNSEIEALLGSAATGSGMGETIMKENEDITDGQDEYEEYEDYEKEEEEEDFIESSQDIEEVPISVDEDQFNEETDSNKDDDWWKDPFAQFDEGDDTIQEEHHLDNNEDLIDSNEEVAKDSSQINMSDGLKTDIEQDSEEIEDIVEQSKTVVMDDIEDQIPGYSYGLENQLSEYEEYDGYEDYDEYGEFGEADVSVDIDKDVNIEKNEELKSIRLHVEDDVLQNQLRNEEIDANINTESNYFEDEYEEYEEYDVPEAFVDDQEILVVENDESQESFVEKDVGQKEAEGGPEVEADDNIMNKMKLDNDVDKYDEYDAGEYEEYDTDDYSINEISVISEDAIEQKQALEHETSKGEFPQTEVASEENQAKDDDIKMKDHARPEPELKMNIEADEVLLQEEEKCEENIDSPKMKLSTPGRSLASSQLPSQVKKQASPGTTAVGAALPILLPKIGRSLVESPIAVQLFAITTVGNIALQRSGMKERFRRGKEKAEDSATGRNTMVSSADDLYEVDSDLEESDFIEEEYGFGYGRPRPHRNPKNDFEDEYQGEFMEVEEGAFDASNSNKEIKQKKKGGRPKHRGVHGDKGNSESEHAAASLSRRPNKRFAFFRGKKSLELELEELQKVVDELTKRAKEAESTREQLTAECDSATHQLRWARQELEEVSKTNTYLKNQLADNKKVMERAVHAERQKTNIELNRLRDQMVEVLDKERRLMRSQFSKHSAMVRSVVSDCLKENEYDYVEDDYDG